MENPSRRRMLVAGLTGAAATVLSAQRAAATTPPDSTSPDSTAPGTTTAGTAPAGTATDGTATDGTATDGTGTAPDTTAAPQRPTGADNGLLAQIQGLELAAADLYQAAIDAGAAGDSDRVLAAGRDHHLAAGNVLSGLIGTAAPQERDEDFFTEHQADFESGDLAAVATTGAELENTLIATYVDIVGQLQGVDGAKMVSAIIVGHARRATTLVDLSGQGDDPAALFENSATALSLPATEEG